MIPDATKLKNLQRDLAMMRRREAVEASRHTPCGMRMAFIRRQIKWIEREIAELARAG